MQSGVLDILKRSDVGLTLDELRRKCKENAIEFNGEELNQLERQGYIRHDDKLLKALPKAFEK